nr:ATP synthase F1 subunit delta [uncultured Holophaga sp.]
MSTLVSYRYAKALLEIGTERGNLDALRQELQSVEALVRAHADLQRLTAYPLLAPAKRAEAFDAVLEKAGTSDVVRKFFKVVAHAARLYLIHQIVEAFAELVDRHNGVIVAKVATARPLSENQTATLSATLSRRTGKTVRMRVQQDPALLGGLKVQLGSTVYDASLQGRLSLLKSQLLSA